VLRADAVKARSRAAAGAQHDWGILR